MHACECFCLCVCKYVCIYVCMVVSVSECACVCVCVCVCVYVYMYEGESNENHKIVIKIRNTARLSCKLATVILMVWTVTDRWQYDGGTQHDGVAMCTGVGPTYNMHQRGTAFCHSFFTKWRGETHRNSSTNGSQYGDACLSLQQVYEWSRKLLNGVSSVTDSPRPGQAKQVVTPQTIAAVETMVKENRPVTTHEIAAHLDMSRRSAHLSSMMLCSTIKRLQDVCQACWQKNWKNDVLMPARNFWNALKQKVMAF